MSPFLWVVAIGLGIVVGLFALANALGRASAAGISEMADPKFTTMEFAELPPWVRKRLAGLRDEFTALGFRELTNYIHHWSRLNYSCVFVSPDGLTQAVAWVARSRGITLWAAGPFLGWSAFKNELFALPRFALTTQFPDSRFIETTPVELLARNHVAGEMEFVIVPPKLSMGEVRERHVAAAQAFAARQGTNPLPITSEQQYLEGQRDMSIRMADKLRREAS